MVFYLDIYIELLDVFLSLQVVQQLNLIFTQDYKHLWEGVYHKARKALQENWTKWNQTEDPVKDQAQHQEMVKS